MTLNEIKSQLGHISTRTLEPAVELTNFIVGSARDEISPLVIRAQNEVSGLQAKVVELEQRRTAATSELNRAQEALPQAQEALDDLNQKIAAKEKRHSDLVKALDEVNKQLKSRLTMAQRIFYSNKSALAELEKIANEQIGNAKEASSS